LKRIRVLLARMPTLLLDTISHVVASAPDMTVVGKVQEHDFAAAVKRARADAILVGEDEAPRTDEYTALLLKNPRLKVLAISDDGRTGTLHEMRPHRIPLGAISAETLRDAIRGRAREEFPGDNIASHAEAQTLPR
jgi:DNA-binding NarL/FixJ family response regulator